MWLLSTENRRQTSRHETATKGRSVRSTAVLSVLAPILCGMAEQPPPPERRPGREPVDLSGSRAGMGVAFEAARRRGQNTDDSRSWDVGAKGERQAAEMLDRLTTQSCWDRLLRRPPGWHVLHSVPLRTTAGESRGDIDHVVIGPPGIITINTKHHRNGRIEVDGEVLAVNGRRTRYIPAARAEADRTREMLKTALASHGGDNLASTLRVRAVLLIVGTMPKIRQAPGDVAVVPLQRLISTVTTLPADLDAPQARRVFDIARWGTAWTLPA